MRTVVSGIGLVSAAGMGVAETLAHLKAGRSGIVSVPGILHTGNRLPVGEIGMDNAALKSLLGLDAQATVSRTALLGMLAAQEALADAGVQDAADTALVSATSVGGMDLTEHFYRDFLADPAKGRLRDVKMHDCAASTLAIAAHLGLKGYTATISTACSSAANAVMLGDRLLRHGVADRVLVGGTDALSAFTLNGFKSLMILDENVCRPFDAARSGLNLGEGAGYLVLQREDEARQCYCYLSGYANRNDAFHQTASSAEGEGAFLAMREALQMAGIAPEAVDYINVHGTGTPNNDLSEGRAMQRLFAQVPAFSSTKAFTGHTLAAAGGIEAVLSVLSVRHGYIYPNLNFSTPMPELGLVPQTGFEERNGVCNVLSNSFGFGGNCSSLVFSR